MRRGARCAILSSHRRVRACGQPQSGRDANLTPRRARRSDRGPAEKPSCRCAPPPPGVAFVTLRRIGRCRWDRGERSTTRKRGLRRDLRSQTGAARRVFVAGGGRRQARKKALSWGRCHPGELLRAERGPAAFPGGPRRRRACSPADDRGGAPQAVMARITVDVRACRFGRACRVGAKR